MKPLETSFERIETKYLVSKTDLQDLIEDLKDYLVEDDYPTSTISNIYFDTEDFQLIQESLQDQHKKEKIRMRTYLAQPSADSPVFLEIKSKDDSGVGHKHRVLAQSNTITQLITKGWGGNLIKDSFLVAEVQKLRQRYSEVLKPRIYISYDRFSLKEKEKIQGFPYQKIRVTLDQNLIYRDENVSLFADKEGLPLLEDELVIMEIKAPGDKPQWLQDILDKYGLVEQKFSKYSCAYHKSQGLAYAPQRKCRYCLCLIFLTLFSTTQPPLLTPFNSYSPLSSALF